MNTSVNRNILGIILLVLTLNNTNAQVPAPQQLLEDTSQQMVSDFIRMQKQILDNPQLAHDLINKNLLPIINFSLMSRWVLGKNWKKASQGQQEEFTARFKELVVKFYSRSLLKYLEHHQITPDIITFKPFRDKEDSKYVTVRSLVHPPEGGEAIKVNYDLYHNAGQWQVYDVSVEGISMVTTYRSSFNQILSQRGMDALLEELGNKVKAIDNKDDNKQVSKQTAVQ